MERIVVRVFTNGGIQFISETKKVVVLLIQHSEAGIGEDPVIAESSITEVDPVHVKGAFKKYVTGEVT